MRIRGLWMVAAGLLGALTTAPPALAQSAEQEQVAMQVTHILMDAIDFKSQIAGGAEKALAGMDFTKVRPEWRPLMLDAFREELDADQPQIEAIMAHAIAKGFTTDELKAGLVVLNAPEMRAVLKAVARHEPTPPPANPPCAPECVTAITSPAGRAFAAKAANISNLLNEDLQKKVVVAIVPGVFVRFGEKARAYDRTHPLP